MPKAKRTLPPNALIHPVWGLRFFVVAALVLVAAALFLSHNDALRTMCLGGALGVLLGGLLFAFQVEDVTMKSSGQPSDVEPYTLR